MFAFNAPHMAFPAITHNAWGLQEIPYSVLGSDGFTYGIQLCGTSLVGSCSAKNSGACQTKQGEPDFAMDMGQ